MLARLQGAMGLDDLIEQMVLLHQLHHLLIGLNLQNQST